MRKCAHFNTKIVDEYVSKYSGMTSRALARKIYEENKTAFVSFDSVRSAIRYRRGAQGIKHRKTSFPRYGAFTTPPSRFNANNPLNLPASDEIEWNPFDFDGAERLGIISDLHIPYHNVAALTCAIQDCQRHRVDGILINGDLIDLHQLSRFVRDPKKRDFKGERETAVAFLERLREIFPKARIVFKAGNHDERLWAFCAQRIPELYADTKIEQALSLPALLQLDKFGIEFVGEKREVMAGKLPILHGHEFRQGFAPPVNPARGAYLKAKECVMVSHHHKSSEHTETTLGRRIVTTWSIGCLCELRPQYDPFNGWNHGHAIVEISGDGNYHVMNKRQLDGKVL